MITIYSNLTHNLVDTKRFIFGGGESYTRLMDGVPSSATIVLNFSQDGDMVELAMWVDALRRAGCKSISLHIPYFPGARQDRVCNLGEPLSVKVYADLINSMNFDGVTILDPHSEVTGAVLDRVRIVDNHRFVADALYKINEKHLSGTFTLISPDAGSNKKIFGVAKEYKGAYPVVRADKLRNLATGEIVDIQVFATEEDLKGKTAIIIDDIASRCGTFLGLAKKLKALGASNIYLIVTHFEGTANLAAIKESGIDGIYTTNSKPFNTNDYNKKGLITIFNADKYMIQ